MKYKPGDLVRLRSGGPDMTVVSVTTEPSEEYKCSWFDGDGKYGWSEFSVYELQAWESQFGFTNERKE